MCGCWSRAVVLISAQEPLAAERRAEVGVQDLDGDVAVVLEVVREIDGRHAAGAELALDAVAIGERRSQAREDVVVRHEEGPAVMKAANVRCAEPRFAVEPVSPRRTAVAASGRSSLSARRLEFP